MGARATVEARNQGRSSASRLSGRRGRDRTASAAWNSARTDAPNPRIRFVPLAVLVALTGCTHTTVTPVPLPPRDAR